MRVGQGLWRVGLILGVVAACALSAGTLAYQRGGGAGGGAQSLPVAPLRFHYMGPPTGGRIASAVGIPGDPSTYYLGSASGGVWKSTDGGSRLTQEVYDEQNTAIAALAV